MKAQQKRMLCDLAIEGGNFTTTFFKQDSVKDLFNVNLEDKEEKMDVVVAKKPTQKQQLNEEKDQVETAAKEGKAVSKEQYEKVSS